MPEKSAFSRLKLVRTDDLPPPPIAPSPYIELGVTSPFSFLRGASDANELVPAALGLGYDAIGIADRNTLAGVVRMHSACTAVGIKPLIGCRLDVLVRCAEPARLPDRPRRLWAALAAAQPGQDAIRERRMRDQPRRCCGASGGHRLHRVADDNLDDFEAEFRGFARRCLHSAMSRRTGFIAATTRHGSSGSTASRRRMAARSSPPTTSIITRPTGARCRTSSPASARK